MKRFGSALRRGAMAVWKQLLRRPWTAPFEEFCQKSNAKIFRNYLLPSPRAELQHGPFVISLQCLEGEDGFSAEASTRFTVDGPLGFSIASTRLLASRTKALFVERFYTGDRSFDDEVAVFGADQPLLTGIFADFDLRKLLLKYQDVHVVVSKSREHSTFKLTVGDVGNRGQMTASFSTAPTSAERFHDLIDLIKLLLDQLCVVEAIALRPDADLNKSR